MNKLPSLTALMESVDKQFDEIWYNSESEDRLLADAMNGGDPGYELKSFLHQVILETVEVVGKVTGETSDGYHTFNELYEFRKLYNAALFNEWASQGKYGIHKSKKHHDGELCFGGGWFIVSANLPAGQISNHYELKDWDLFKCEERELAEEWDGHTPEDVRARLSQLMDSLKEKP